MNSIALVGKPNSGKSLLFNRLTGMSQRVTNFPGITVEIKQGQRGDMSFLDFPGFYSFAALTQEEVISVEKFSQFIEESKVSLIICVLDANQLKSSLRMGLEVRSFAAQANVPICFVVNMMDELDSWQSVDVKGLAKALGCPVIPLSAKTGQGLNHLLSLLKDETPQVPSVEDHFFYEESLKLSEKYGPKSDRGASRQQNIDGFFLSPFFGVLSFLVIMTVLFQAVFTFSVPFMDFIDNGISTSGNFVARSLPAGFLKDFLVDALFGGLGSFLVFIPQIFFLTLIIGILEDSGYLARAAMLCHRPLRFFGLSGKSFIPMLTGHACAIPAIYATRMIDSPMRRFLTILVLPLMGCSARLPVYAFLIAAVIPQTRFFGGLIGMQGLALFLMYLFGISVALLVSWALSRNHSFKTDDLPFILELPRYRLPHWKPLILRSFQSVWKFLTRAGGIIFTVTVVVWVLGYFPNNSLENSYLGFLGKGIQPLLTPLGLDWKYGVAILTSFLAREIFVGTLGTLFEIENAEENFNGLLESVQQSGLSFASGMALLVFYAIALQCASTFAVLKNELGHYKWPVFLLVGYGVLAYFASWLLYLVLV